MAEYDDIIELGAAIVRARAHAAEKAAEHKQADETVAALERQLQQLIAGKTQVAPTSGREPRTQQPASFRATYLGGPLVEQTFSALAVSPSVKQFFGSPASWGLREVDASSKSGVPPVQKVEFTSQQVRDAAENIQPQPLRDTLERLNWRKVAVAARKTGIDGAVRDEPAHAREKSVLKTTVDRIRDLFDQNPYTSFGPREIADRLLLPQEKEASVRRFLRRMLANGFLISEGRGMYQRNPMHLGDP